MLSSLKKEHKMKGKTTMNPISILDFVNVFSGGMLAGMEFLLHYGVRTTPEVLDELSQLKFRKALVLKARVLVPAFFLPTALSGVAITFLNGFDAGFWLRGVGVFALGVWTWLRVIGTVPINSATVDWPVDNPPKDWKERINRAERFHIVGVWSAIVAFASFLLAVALKVGTF